MSSLMQHHGGYHKTKGVELLLYLQHRELTYGKGEKNIFSYGPQSLVGEYCPLMTSPVDSEPIELCWNDKKHIVPKLYRIYRKPCGMFGCWVVFRYNGKENVPDLSVPIAVEKLPRDATPLSDEDSIAYWSKEN
jgi:hypothetical protein